MTTTTERPRYMVEDTTGRWQCTADGYLLKKRSLTGYLMPLVAWRPCGPVSYVGFGLENLPPNPSPAALDQIRPQSEREYWAEVNRKNRESWIVVSRDVGWVEVDSEGREIGPRIRWDAEEALGATE